MNSSKLAEVVKNIDVATKSIQMYSENHPRTQQSIDQAFKALDEELPGRGSITFSLAEGSLLAEGEPMDKGNPLIERFTKDLFIRNIHSVSFIAGLTRMELIGFMKLLNLKPQRIKELGGFEKILESENIKNVQANKIRYGIITGQGMVNEDQALLSQLLSALKSAGIRSQETETLERPMSGPEVADTVFGAFEKLGQTLPVAPEEQQAAMRAKFLEMFHSFSPDMKANLLVNAVNKRNYSLSSFYQDLSPEELELSVLASVRHSAEPDVRAMVSRLFGEKVPTVTESLKRKLADSGLLEPEHRSNPWDEILAKESLAPEEIEKSPAFLGLMIQANALADADRFSKRLFGYLTGGSTAQRSATVRTIPGIISVLSQNEKWKSIDLSLSFLLTNCFRKETDPEVLVDYCSLFMGMLGRNFDAAKWRECQEQMSLLSSKATGSEGLMNRIAEGLKLFPPSFVEAVRQEGSPSDHAMEILRGSEYAGASYLLDMLAEEEDQKGRKRLLEHIENLDRKFLFPEIERRLSEPRWFVVRNMVTILGRLKTPESDRLLERAATYPDPKVAKEIVKRLYNSSAPSDEPVVVRLMSHPDKAIRMQGVHLASMIHAASAVQVLLHMIVDKNPMDTDLRAAAYQSLLRIKPQEAVPSAISLLERRAAGKTDMAERNAAVRVLGETGKEQHRALLEKIAATDVNAETRQIAQSYL